MHLDSAAGARNAAELEGRQAARGLRFTLRTGWSFARHSLATLATAAVACAIWTITYLFLLLWAGFFGGGLGGPLAYPGGLVAVLLLTAVVCLVVLAPATGIADWVARRYELPFLIRIPLSLGALLVLCTAAVVAGTVGGVFSSLSEAIGTLAVLVLVLSLPLGVYWWIAEAVPFLLATGRALVGRAQTISTLRSPFSGMSLSIRSRLRSNVQGAGNGRSRERGAWRGIATR